MSSNRKRDVVNYVLLWVGSWVAEPPGILDLDSKLGTAVAKKPGSVRVKYLLNNQVGAAFPIHSSLAYILLAHSIVD
jgi:hypothetical protein